VAKRRAVAAPNPEVAPVTNMVFAITCFLQQSPQFQLKLRELGAITYLQYAADTVFSAGGSALAVGVRFPWYRLIRSSPAPTSPIGFRHPCSSFLPASGV